MNPIYKSKSQIQIKFKLNYFYSNQTKSFHVPQLDMVEKYIQKAQL